VGEEAEDSSGFRETRKTVVTGVECSSKQLDEGMAGDMPGACCCGGIAKEDVERRDGGLARCRDRFTPSLTQVRREVYILRKERRRAGTRPFFKGLIVRSLFADEDVTGMAELPAGTEMVMPGDNVSLVIELITPVAMEKRIAVGDPRRRTTRWERHDRRRDYYVQCKCAELCSAWTGEAPVPTQTRLASLPPDLSSRE